MNNINNQTILNFIQANPNLSYEYIINKFGLTKRIAKRFDNGINKVEFRFKDDVIMTLHLVDSQL